MSSVPQYSNISQTIKVTKELIDAVDYAGNSFNWTDN